MLINKERPSSGGHTYKVDIFMNSSLKTPLGVEVGDDIAKERNSKYHYTVSVIYITTQMIYFSGFYFDLPYTK